MTLPTLMDLFDVDVPLANAPMAGVAGGRLAAAVCRAGALGMVGISGDADASWTNDQLDIAAGERRPYGAGLVLWALDRNPGVIDPVLERGVPLVSISFGDPGMWPDKIHEAGSRVAVQAGNPDEARRAIDAGCDVLVVRGSEGGGHGRGEIGTLPLLQEVMEFATVPVVVGGGISTARGLAAIMAAGASGAWVGTPFTACHESDNAEALKDAIIEAQSGDTVYTTLFDIARGVPWPAEYGGRALVNDFFRSWEGREDELRDPDLVAGVRAAIAEDDTSTTPIWVGESVGTITSTASAHDIVTEFAAYRHHLETARRRLAD